MACSLLSQKVPLLVPSEVSGCSPLSMPLLVPRDDDGCSLL
jgi:hypothetical protein